MKIRPTARGGDRKSWHTDEYVEYLQSEAWARIRAEALERAGHRCENVYVLHRVVREEGDTVWTQDHATRCAETTGLEVHHKTYESLGSEAWGDLIVLCHEHHLDADRRRAGPRRPR